MSIVWDQLTFTAKNPCWTNFIPECLGGSSSNVKERKILQGLRGSIKRGELTALMGPSGAGKSTLLNCLIDGVNYDGFDGHILNHDFDDESLRSCFITQDEKEHLLLNLTVKEALETASKIKNTKKKEVNYKGILRKLRLESVENTIVGACSGGQKKRLAIGLELACEPKPNLMFLDEPTSGLDSFVGEQVIHLLRELAESENIAIVTTIHQPSFKVFSMFHNVYILSKVGKFIFSGPPEHLLEHIEKYHEPCPIHVNPADLIIEIASSAINSSSSTVAGDGLVGGGGTNELNTKLDPNSDLSLLNGSYRKACANMTGHYIDKVYNPLNSGIFSTTTTNNDSNSNIIELNGGLCSNRSTKFKLKNLVHLTYRTFISSCLRQKGLLFIRFALHSIVALALVTLYNRNIGQDDGCLMIDSNMDHDSSTQFTSVLFSCQSKKMNPDCSRQDNTTDLFDDYFDGDLTNCTCIPDKYLNFKANNINGSVYDDEGLTTQNVKFHFFSLLFLMFAALMPTVLTFPAEIKIFLNEHRNGWYPTSSYYISKTLIEFLIQLPYPFFYTWFLYWYSSQIGMESWYSGFFGFMSSRYGHFLIITLLSCYIAQGLGFLIGILCVKSFNSTIIVSSSTLLYLFLFSGFFVKRVHLPSHSKWLTTLSFIRFSFESLLIIIYGKGRCDDEESDIENSDSDHNNIILSSFDLKDSDLLPNLIWLIGHLIIIRTLAFIALKSRVDPKLVKGWFGVKWLVWKLKPCWNPCCKFVPNVKLRGQQQNNCLSWMSSAHFKRRNESGNGVNNDNFKYSLHDTSLLVDEDL